MSTLTETGYNELRAEEGLEARGRQFDAIIKNRTADDILLAQRIAVKYDPTHGAKAAMAFDHEVNPPANAPEASNAHTLVASQAGSLILAHETEEL